MVRKGRPELALGELGDISYTETKSAAGKVTGYRARARWRRPSDGVVLPKEKAGKSKSAAKAALKEYIDQLNKESVGSRTITPHTKIPVLADLYLIECERDESMSDATVALYRDEIEPTVRRLRKDGRPDGRVKPDALRIKTAFAELSVRELTTPRYVEHEQSMLDAGKREKAQRHRIVVRGMMNLAIRHGAVPPGGNPVTGLRPIPSTVPDRRALTPSELRELRAQLQAWSRGEAIPGGAKGTGRTRDPALVSIMDLLMATGTRPGEVLAFRRCDVHRPELVGDPWIIDVFGTVKPPKPGGKPYRQAHTKTGENGKRSVYLTRYAVARLLAMGAHEWDPLDESPVFEAPTGGWRSPETLSSQWTRVRGERFAWVTPKTFRKTVGTAVAMEFGIEQAGLQLGHIPGSPVTRQHYVEPQRLVPDSTRALEPYGADEESSAG